MIDLPASTGFEPIDPLHLLKRLPQPHRLRRQHRLQREQLRRLEQRTPAKNMQGKRAFLSARAIFACTGVPCVHEHSLRARAFLARMPRHLRHESAWASRIPRQAFPDKRSSKDLQGHVRVCVWAVRTRCAQAQEQVHTRMRARQQGHTCMPIHGAPDRGRQQDIRRERPGRLSLLASRMLPSRSAKGQEDGNYIYKEGGAAVRGQEQSMQSKQSSPSPSI